MWVEIKFVMFDHIYDLVGLEWKNIRTANVNWDTQWSKHNAKWLQN